VSSPMGLAIQPICAGFHKMAISGLGPPQSNCATTRSWKKARRGAQTGRGRPAACIGNRGSIGGQSLIEPLP
jgi:hypothetical protein